MTALAFINVNGAPVDTTKRVKLEKRTSTTQSFHKGWAVEGIPPGAVEAAREEHLREREVAINAGAKRIPDEWSEQSWVLQKAKFKRVRTKAYEIPSAAEKCRELAEKAGWKYVAVRALSAGS